MIEGRAQIEVLGPIRVIGPEGRDLTPTGALQRRLLALLVLQRGRVVSIDTALHALWPGGLPRDPTGALQNHLSRLRHSLPAGVVESTGDGYRLDATRIDVDTDQLSRALGEAGEGGTDSVAIDAILRRWHGPAYPELDHVDEARFEAVRLDELRVRAREVRAEQRLAQGELDGLVGELTALIDDEPLRERPRSLLMHTLEATGRHVEALRVYDDFRRLLGGELGIEPSPALRGQHAALLAAGDDPIVPSEPAWSPRGRLPVPPTSLLARSELADEVISMVESSRLVTLVGLGGVGKTRLLVEVGHRLRSARPDRPVVLCELATADESSTVGLVAAALGIDARPGVPLVERVAGVVGDAELVVLADNCEHVLAPIAELANELVAHCPNITVVATSRERLRVPGEQVCPVPTLSVEGDHPAAVQLFIERARAVVPDFEPGPHELACIAEIVRRLDGLPLAIELAAARLHTHDVYEVASGLDHRFSLLTSGYRTTARHESLRAAVSWSFGLLEDELQQVFSSLSIFAGSFTTAGAAAVCGIDIESARAALAQLAERSLVMRTNDRRYVLLETLRAFGADHLEATGRADGVGERHARHLVEWVEQARDRLGDPAESAIAEIDDAIPELRAALGWLIEHGEIELAGREVVALLDYAILRLRPDVLAWAETITNADPDDLVADAPMVWVAAAYAAWMAGDLGETGARSVRALAVAEQRGGPVPPMVTEANGNWALFEGRLDEAIGYYQEAVANAVDHSPERLFVGATELLALGYADHPDAEDRCNRLLAEVADSETPYAAYVWYCAGETDLDRNPPRARTRFIRAIELAEATNTSFVTGIARASKASIDARIGDPLVAAEEYRHLIDHWRRAGMWSTQWTMLRSIAALLARLGRHRDAAILTGAVLATDEGHRIFGADEVALGELERLLRDRLGDKVFDLAAAEGAVLDGDAAVEHALSALRTIRW